MVSCKMTSHVYAEVCNQKNPTAVAELTIMEVQENIHLQFLHQEENFVHCWIVTYSELKFHT